MFEGAVAGILNRLLGKYVQDLDTENLNVGIISGNVSLTDLKLKPEALYELDLPIDVKIGTIGRINLQIPWAGLYTQPVIVHIEDVLILVGPAISNSYFDPDRERRLTRAAKRKILQDLEAESEILKGPQNFFEHLFTAIVNNIQIYIRNIHVRYEDSISSKDGPLACGLCLQSLSIETSNSKWKPSVTPANATTVYQMMKIESLSVYWNPTATALDDNEIAHITPMQYYNWKHYMLTGLNKFSMHHEDFEFLLKPVTCKVKVLINRSGEARVPRLLIDAVLQDSALQLSRRQYLSIDNLLSSFARIKLNRKYRHLHPGVPLTKDIKKWWRYAYNVVVEQRVRPYTWAAIKKHRENYNEYKQTYKSTLRSPNDTELKLDLQKCEDSLPIISVVIAREQAKFELLSQESDRIEVVETEIDWWLPSGSDVDSDPEENKRVELCVKSERSKSLWSHLSSPEKKRVCELIGYVEGESKQDKSKQYIEHKLNLTLANCSLTLMNRSKEVLVVTLTQFLASLETRPSAKAFKLSARAESIVIEGVTFDGELVPLLSVERGAPTATNLLALDLERNPSNSDADYGLCCSLEPLELLYIEHAFTELINFFQTHSMTSEELAEEVAGAAKQAARISKSVLAYAVSRRKLFQINVDIKGPCVVIPEHGCVHKSGRVMVLDISRIIIKSDLQPPNLALEDATCMELEERLYDRLHAECSCQVLFCEWNDPWRETRKHADSELHLIPKIRALLVFSNSIKKEYRLLPRYKLNISLSSFKLNLSDRIIGLLMDFADNLPVPVPNTVPVSFLDSGDYEEEDPELAEAMQQDLVTGDPGYDELVKLRQKIVASYLSRNKAETQGEESRTPLGNLAAEPAFSSTDHTDEELELYARSVDLPGFDDNVSPNNTIRVLLRFVIGEIVINLSRSTDQTEKPYVMLSITKVCLDVALMEYGPAVQLSVGQALLTDKQHHSSTGQYLELLTSSGELFNLLYRKVRADCPEFRSHFHSVEQSLVADAGQFSLLLHADAIRTLFKYTQYICDKIQTRHALNLKKIVVPKTKSLWDYLMRPEEDPPVPSGATKFSYSVRVTSVSMRLCHLDCSLVEIRLAGLESDCVFRANDRMIFKLYLSSLHLDDLSEATLYPKLVWPDEDKVLEVKYVRAAPRYYGTAPQLKAHGELRVYLGRLHVVLFYSVLHHLQQFVEPLAAGSAAGAVSAAECAAGRRVRSLRRATTRLNLAIQIHAPVLLLPQKPSSPNLLVFNLGDLLIENFFKQTNASQEATSPMQNPIIDNILIKLVNITFSRAVMTLAGTLEMQEPILEPVSVRCDVQRALRRETALEADVLMDTVLVNLGQKDLATILAVWADNLSNEPYIGTIIPGSPVEVPATDASVKKLQAFFAQGEPIRKEAVLRFTLEGIELKLFSDMDEVLSSPVRDLNHGLAKLTAGEATLQLDWYSDNSAELKASLQSLLVEDIRPDPSIVIKRIVQSQGGVTRATGGISVRRPALLECSARLAGARAAQLDVRVDRMRCNLALPFLLQLARTTLDAMPGEKTMDGGVVNHGYVGELGAPRANNNRAASSSDSTSGYYSATTSISEETPGLSISIQFRQPEVMFFTDLTKSDGHALLLRTELLIDYSSHSSSENLVVSLAGLQIMSKLQSKLKNLPPQLVLKPCDVEFSKSFKNVEEGVKVKLSVSEIEVHIAATTVHTVMDIIDEISSELTIPDEKEPFNFATYNPKLEKQDEDLWSPKKITPYVLLNHEDSYVPPKYPAIKPTESFLMTIPNVRIIFEIEQTVRVPVLMMKLSGELALNEWSRQLQGTAWLRLHASCYNERVDAWEPVIEPVVCEENLYRPWEITATLFQAKAYPMSSRLDTAQPETETDHSPDTSKRTRKRSEFESETSADECDTDNEMTFIRNPNRDNKHCNVDLSAGNISFLGALDIDESDSENENGLMDKLANAIGHLFTDDSSADEMSNDEDSSAPEQSEPEVCSDHDEDGKPVSYIDGDKGKKDVEHKTVTLQEPVREDSVDSGLETESFAERMCTYIMLEARHPLNVTVTPAGARCLLALANACSDRTAVVTAIVTADSGLVLVNDIGPGSTVHLKTRAETDLAGNDRVLAIADYDVDTSRPSTPGCDTSSAELLDDVPVKNEMIDVTDDWDCCFEGGFPAGGMSPAPPPEYSPEAPPPPKDLRTKLTDLTLNIRLHDLDHLTILCPQRNVSKLHVLHPSKNSTRYYIVVERTSKYNNKKIVVRSPLQLRNETSYALELFYKKTDLQAVGADLIGAVTNPFDDKLRLAVIAPQDTYNVPLYIAYHCKLFLLPSNFESYQTATQGIWWMELANDLGTARDVICPAKDGGDDRIFAMRIITVEGCQSHKVSRNIPNYLIRIVPPLAIYNRLPHALQLSSGPTVTAGGAVDAGATVPGRWHARVEAGERAHTHALDLTRPHRLTLEMHYMGLPWTGSFTLSQDLTEKIISMSSEFEADGKNGKQVLVCVRVERNECWQLYVHAQHWVINKTGLPLQLKGRQSEAWHAVSEEPLLWSAARARRRGERVRLRAHQSGWSRAAPLAAAAPGLVVCAHAERRTTYRLLLNVTLSELCPQLTKIVTLLPYFLVYNDTKRHLRFMEENEAADLWFDLAPQQCTPFWPQTDSMSMHCKYRDSTVVSQHFPITKNHFTVLRMDKGSAICVEVTGGTDRPFIITFKPYSCGDAPVRIDNLCDDLFLKLHQEESGQVALLSPYQSMLYTWDDPAKERKLIWNIYNNKGKGFVADFNQDGFGEEKVSFHSVKHSTLVATSSVTSKLSSTLKRLTPKSPEPCSSSSDDSDSSDMPETHSKTKKMRKDKVIVYWISYMDGYQRVFALAQDERIAYQYRMRINSERSNYEVYMSLAGVSLSVCVQTNTGVKELAYVSVTDSLPRWEVHVSCKWKQLSPDLTAWIEDKYQTEQKKCQLKEYIHIDLEKMQMTKPFFSELRRTYNPGIWLQFRKSDTYTYCHLKVQRLQIDNQLNDAVFPSVLYPAPLPAELRTSRDLKSCIEIVSLKQHRPTLNQDIYKYLKVLVRDYCINLDRGFVNHVFDILNHWKIEEKPAVRLRADLALVHMPLPIIALKSQTNVQRNVIFEYVHLSPIKLVLSLSSRGYLAENTNSPSRARFGNKKENRPKLFNSDLLEYLFNSWGSSLCDMKDVEIRMSYMEVRNAPITISALLDNASRHYWMQLVQQFYVLVLGLNILGNPYSQLGDFAKALKNYYEPCLGTIMGRRVLDVASKLAYSAAALLGQRASSDTASAVFDDVPRTKIRRRPGEDESIKNDLPEPVVEADRGNPTSVALALTGLIARPSFDMCRDAARSSLSRQLGLHNAENTLKACVERSGGRLVARSRLPRHCPSADGVRPYSLHAALGAALLGLLARGHYADTDAYVAHAHLARASHYTLLVSTQHVFMVRAGGNGSWHIEWVVKLDDVIGVPLVRGDKLILNIKQDEMVSYFSTDEKIIEISDPEVLAWLQAKIECALILALEDKRCSE
ncbi:intermembrane lipid transfer protein VPS13A-like isoform X2 [Galleria mellonella]|uniref:Intermembrane lipid transfer protein VPS13A-like isoform X2 n=1 Tax=Galleria mellonella TaxID=7137 RepID=A0A6J1WG76_GALME|nr:intermembrane lipid transfer protein VPS13A-like isoform X2 [Galleria mellonella]